MLKQSLCLIFLLEPSAEVLVSWKDEVSWEILGCGMVDPNVFKHVKYKKGTQGFALV